MKRHLFLLSVIVGTLVSICSCTLPNGVSIGSGGTASIHFDKISLKYDFSKKFQTNFIQDDYDEFKRTHNITYSGRYPFSIPVIPVHFFVSKDRYLLRS